MAFNPFHAFRKHQKVLLAGITLVAMFSFILCSGLASRSDAVFDFFVNLFGGTGRNRTPPVTKLYGKTVNTAEVGELLRERRLAQDALGRANALARQEISLKLQKLGEIKETDADAKREQADLYQQVQQLSPPQAPYPQFPQFSMPPGPLFWRTFAPFQDMDKLDNLLDFMVWRHQAEKLGIDLTSETINKALKELTLGYADLQKVYQAMRADPRAYGGGNAKQEEIEHALAEEFRVRIVQAAVLGYEPVQPDNPNANPFGPRPAKPLVQVPAPVTPYEFRNRYLHLRTGIDVALVPVPVKPNEEKKFSEQDQLEMRAMYNLYKDREPAPDQSTPGFKVPRKLAVEWVEARPNDPYYQKIAPQLRTALDAVQRGAGFVPPAGGGSLGAVLGPTLFPSFFNSRELAAYNELKTWNSPYKLPSWTEAGYVAGLYTTRPRVEDAAALAGRLVSAGPGLPLDSIAALGSYQATIRARNQKDKDFEAFVTRSVKDKQRQETLIQAGVALAAVGGNPAPLVAAAALEESAQPERYLPMNLLREQVAKAADLSLSKDVMVGSLTEFKKGLDTNRGTAAKAKDYLNGDKSKEGAIQKYALRHGIMDRPVDRYEIAKVKALEPLLEAYRREARLEDAKAENFSKLFFGPDVALYRPGSVPGEQRWHDAEEVFLFWTVQDEKAYVPTYEQAKAAVEKAWELQKARPATRKEADELLAKLEKADGDLRRIRDVAAQARTDVITLPGYVFRQVPATKTPAAPMAAQTFEGYKFPDTFSYPRTSEWLDKILGMKKKGDAVLLVNQPETVFYVAVALHDPEVPGDAKIAQAYGGGLFSTDPLLAEMIQERQKEHREQAMKELRVAAGAPLDAQHNYEVPEDVRKQFAGRNSSGDTGE
jgi:hypothetical protein